jgi:hypothetical protein
MYLDLLIQDISKEDAKQFKDIILGLLASRELIFTLQVFDYDGKHEGIMHTYQSEKT